MDYRDYFRGKKITLMGLGLLGRGLGDAKFLAECDTKLIVTDLKSAKDLDSSLKKLKKYKNIKFTLGKHKLQDFKNRDLIIKAAGVPLDSPFIAEARKNGIPVMMSTALFAKLSGAKIIGVTGTRGKTTVTQLIYKILKQWQGSPLTSGKVWLGGNILGVSTLALLPKVKPADWVVLELDSWQLQGFGELKLSPQIAVFTNFMPDHQNYYQGDMKAYLTDKENIFKYQKPEDHLVRGETVQKLSKNWRLKIPGEHNRINVACAVAVARILQIPERIIKKTVENFAGVAGRLELIRIWRRIKIYNDTTSTTPEALKVALEALGRKKKNIILIMGGADKNLEIKDEVIKIIQKYCQEIILLPGTGTKSLKRKMKNLKFKEIKSMEEAVDWGLNVAKKEDILLLSPGFASFGPPPGGFKNEYDRGAQFVKLVKRLK